MQSFLKQQRSTSWQNIPSLPDEHCPLPPLALHISHNPNKKASPDTDSRHMSSSRIGVHTNIHAHTHKHTRTYTHTHTHTHTHAYTHTCAHTSRQTFTHADNQSGPKQNGAHF